LKVYGTAAYSHRTPLCLSLFDMSFRSRHFCCRHFIIAAATCLFHIDVGHDSFMLSPYYCYMPMPPTIDTAMMMPLPRRCLCLSAMLPFLRPPAAISMLLLMLPLRAATYY